jgi:DNA-binding LytR/AlgR family response regulator
MPMLKLVICICDDSAADLTYIESHLRAALESKDIEPAIHTYIDPKKLLDELAAGALRPDVIFVDIDMPTLSGMDVAAELNLIFPEAEIVFVTNHDEFVYKAYRFKAIGFIRKRYFDREIGDTLDIICEHIQRNNKRIMVDCGDYTKAISIADIMYVMSDDHYVEIYSADSRDVLRKSINSFESEYAKFGLIRVHSRYIVNYRFIYSVERTTILLTNNDQIPISRNKQKYVKERLQYFSRVI